MSTEGGTPQPPAAGSDKSRAPKPSTFSATINKSGKAFAPKKGVIRRRPGVGANAPASKTSEPAASTVEAHVVQSESQSQTQPDPTLAVEQQTAPQLPTPAATQDHTAQDAPPTEQAISGTPIAVAESSDAVVPPVTLVEPSPIPVSTDEELAPQQEEATDTVPPIPSKQKGTPRPTDEELESSPSPKRRRLELPRANDSSQVEPPAQQPEPLSSADDIGFVPRSTEPSQSEQEHEITAAPKNVAEDSIPDTDNHLAAPTEALTQPPRSPTQETETADKQTPESQAAKPTRPKRRKLPWTAVNAPRNDGDEPVATTRTRQTRGKRRHGAMTLRQIDEEEHEALEEEEPAVLIAPKRLSAKARGKRKVGETDEDIHDDQRPAKKPRKPRKDKGKKKAANEEANGEIGEPAEAEETQPKRKPRKKRARTEQSEGIAEGEESAQQPKHKGRPARAPTPSDAEDEVIDSSTTFMDSLASRNIRVGRLSQRERKMREINWTEVKQRQREQESTQYDSRAAQAEVTRQLNEAAEAQAAAIQQTSGVRFENVDGEIRVLHSSNTIDRQAEADAEIAQMQTVDEDDLTNRVTYKSFMRNNKRHPQEFMLPGQGKRWNWKDTGDFYDALRMFGTDFMMISTLFPNVTRRSVKLKFTREERNNPQKVKEALHARTESTWDEYLAKSGRKDDSFVDHNEVKRQLAEEWDAMQVQIEAAKAAAEEEKRQRKLAGVESDEEAVDKENGKGRKKKDGKKQAKQVAFDTPEEGVEIIGEIDEDDTWGKE